MSDEAIPPIDSPQPDPRVSRESARSWMLRRLCSQNPFYLISVCLVLHGTANWFHADSGVAFSPWPLLWLTMGYTLLLAGTGFAIVRFGRVWDDARSILLIILLLFVQLSLLFDETLVRDPATGRLLLGICWAFSIGLSELLLRGLRIRLPWLFRLPYHGLLTLLFWYPLCLVSIGTRVPTEVVVWRIYLFPVAAAGVLLTLLPAIRRGQAYTRANGTPWVWPWYPWSLFVFLSVCICFRAYALSQSFDPLLGESLTTAMNFSSAFGMYFLIPLVFATAVLLLEIGLVENRPRIVRNALLVPPIACLMSLPWHDASGPYFAFLQRLTQQTGSPLWTTLLAATAFYAVASLRNIPSAERWLAVTVLVLTRVDAQTTDLDTLSSFHFWPLFVLSGVELWLGLMRTSSHRTFVAITSAIVAGHFALEQVSTRPVQVRIALTALLLVLSVLAVGFLYRDRFAWRLRLVGAPLLVMTTIAGGFYLSRATPSLPLWSALVFVLTMTLLAFGYSVLVAMPLYRLASLLCVASGLLGLMEAAITYVVAQSGWHGATSFASGLGCFLIAAFISFLKAGWFKGMLPWLRSMLQAPLPT